MYPAFIKVGESRNDAPVRVIDGHCPVITGKRFALKKTCSFTDCKPLF